MLIVKNQKKNQKSFLFLFFMSFSMVIGWGMLCAQAADPFYGDTPPPPRTDENREENTLTPRANGIKENLSEQFDTTTPSPTTDFFQGELGEAFSSFTETPFIEDKTFPGWRDFSLSMSYDEVTNLIKSSDYPWLTIKGDYEPILVIETNVFFVETYANRYFSNVQFLFDEEQRLYLIRILPLPSYFSFLELIDQFKKKYGKPSELNFKQITWIDSEGTRLELRRDSSIRYIRADILTEGTLSEEATLNTNSSIEADKSAFKADLLESF